MGPERDFQVWRRCCTRRLGLERESSSYNIASKVVWPNVLSWIFSGRVQAHAVARDQTWPSCNAWLGSHDVGKRCHWQGCFSHSSLGSTRVCRHRGRLHPQEYVRERERESISVVV